MLKKKTAAVMAFLACLFFLTAAHAGDILKIPFNKNTIIHLDQDAASLIVNNPNRISVLLDTPRMLIVIPHQEGASSFIALDSQGQTILQQEVVVTNLQEKYVRIRRICNGNDASCKPASYSYCPNGCYDVTAATKTNRGNIPPPPKKPAPAPSALDEDAISNGPSDSSNVPGK